jgi:predicted RNA-binding Zn-ribbon protein involved in translation (DUF1610 family)
MFNNLKEEIRLLNSDVNNVANSEKAKDLRKKLLTIGGILTGVGYGGVFLCFIAFVLGGIGAVNSSNSEFPTHIMIPFILCIPLGIVGSVGAALLSLGLKIAITGYASNLVEETVWNRCPNCGDRITKEELFCNKCGHKLKSKCPECGHINEPNTEYCIKCGCKL